ncbi:TRAP transporter substrate-binding protein [Roseovarius atlanticus]|uniref:TRAP transporter substrate-binding protein n=1 Tax=Roseovarius atlanticus TaxID=1641875 RepID=UPI001C98B143|nr:TRAP transporter substrate-binding protein [Roseovarius atlanticus]MBY5989889.1 TRAP transporter substrate-binding protein [Roseovarius atlanticus]MBY6126434.1 TRAP transporter substrate-binding protein [Roseovarius atlanticus]MBY6150928.1 TRAP transporter substrate-binding protein [Roseovarius atlanticus]
MTFKATILASVAAIAMPLAAGAADMTLRFGHVGNPGSLFEASADAFAECANGKLGDKAEVQTFGASQLGKDRELLQKLKLGQVDFSLPSSVMSSVAPEFGVFEMPYIVKDRDHMRRIQAELGDVFQAAAQREGYRIIGYFENGFRHITNNVRPINKPEDLEGVKLRTPNGEWRVKMFQLYGANPTPMAFSEVFTALQTKVIDGQENPYAQIASAKFQEVQEYLSITGHVYTPGYVLVAENQWQKLPEDVRAELEACGAETQDFVYEHAAKLETELLEVIREAGVEVNEADNQAFIDASAPIYEEFATSVDGGAELIETIQSLASGS